MAARTVPDRVDELVGQWASERPDLDLKTMNEVARLLHVAALIERRIDGTAAEFGLDRGQGDVLFTLRRAGAPYRLTPSQLTAALLVTSGTMTNRLDRLEALGLIRRLPNPADRRGVLIELTDEAREAVDRAVEVHVEREQEMLAPLSAAERKQLDGILRKLVAHLSPGARDGAG
ncbi:MAG TPA: MarR family transcriptional regulator [Capillimicrobium sp.]|nr:MarR family transcriptional regulator [Capillimicrobium sp.]